VGAGHCDRLVRPSFGPACQSLSPRVQSIRVSWLARRYVRQLDFGRRDLCVLWSTKEWPANPDWSGRTQRQPLQHNVSARDIRGMFSRYFAVALILALPHVARAQSATAKSARAARLTGAPPHIDGVLDDAVWAQAPVIADFVQKIPLEGASPSVPTEV